jgi:hypothetical protein
MPTTLLFSVQSFSYGFVDRDSCSPHSPPSPPADASYRVAKIHRVCYKFRSFSPNEPSAVGQIGGGK